MTTSERISHILVALPVAHVLGSSLFLWSYCMGFGSNIIAHATASDLLSVSIRDMVLAYILALLLPGAIAVSRLTSPHPYAIDKALAVPDETKRAEAVKFVKRTRRGIEWFCATLPIFTLALTAFQIYHNEPVPYVFLQFALTISLIMPLMIAMEKRNVSNATFEVTSLTLSFILSLLFTGLDKGQSDRLRTYKYSSKYYTLCKGAAVLRRFSDNFVAILPDDQKAIISADCAVKFTISPIKHTRTPPNPASKKAVPPAKGSGRTVSTAPLSSPSMPPASPPLAASPKPEAGR